MGIAFRPMTEADARLVSSWSYEPPYDLYDGDPEAVEPLLDPANRYHVALDETGEIIGFCCFGPDARVPGGNYPEDALDVGGGLRPDLTGGGRGVEFLRAILRLGRRTVPGSPLRATIAAFNERALRAAEAAGFERSRGFERPDGKRFWILKCRG